MQEKHYSPYAYDENLVLRVPPQLWLIIFWSVHHLLLILLGAFSSGDILKSALEYGGYFPILISNAPGVVVIGARMNRLPDAGARTRWLWNKGRLILAVGLILQIGTMVAIHGEPVLDIENTISWAIGVTLLLLLVLLGSRHIADTFSDFPPPNPVDTEKKTLG